MFTCLFTHVFWENSDATDLDVGPFNRVFDWIHFRIKSLHIYIQKYSTLQLRSIPTYYLFPLYCFLRIMLSSVHVRRYTATPKAFTSLKIKPRPRLLFRTGKYIQPLSIIFLPWLLRFMSYWSVKINSSFSSGPMSLQYMVQTLCF